MSDTAQAGFWQASDGKWYPPQTHPTATMPVVTNAPSANGAPRGIQGSPAPEKRNGCLKYGLIGFGALMLIGIIAAVAGGGSGTAGKNGSSGAAPGQTSKASKPADGAPGIGSPVRDGKFEFVVTRVERPGNTIGESFTRQTAQGEFVIVYVNVTNIGDKAQTLSSSGQVLINDKGQKFEPSSAIFSLPNADKVFLENINPGNVVTDAPLLFDVAPGTVLSEIELHDSIFSGGVTVKLA
jgi:hypothetical protein